MLKLNILLWQTCFTFLIKLQHSQQTGGNQRDLARAKNLKKQQDQGKKADDGLTPLQRRERLVILYKQSPLKHR